MKVPITFHVAVKSQYWGELLQDTHSTTRNQLFQILSRWSEVLKRFAFISEPRKQNLLLYEAGGLQVLLFKRRCDLLFSTPKLQCVSNTKTKDVFFQVLVYIVFIWGLIFKGLSILTAHYCNGRHPDWNEFQSNLDCCVPTLYALKGYMQL